MPLTHTSTLPRANILTSVVATLGLSFFWRGFGSAKEPAKHTQPGLAASGLAESDLEFVASALGHGVDSVAQGGPLVPFVISETNDGTRHLDRFVVAGTTADSMDLGASVQKAQHAARTSSGPRAISVWDGYVTVEGMRSDAILAELRERGKAFLFGQRYSTGSETKPAAAIGKIIYMGTS